MTVCEKQAVNERLLIPAMSAGYPQGLGRCYLRILRKPAYTHAARTICEEARSSLICRLQESSI